MTSARNMLSVTALSCILLHVTPARADLHGKIIDFGEVVAEQERPARETPEDHTLVPRTLIEGIRYVGHTSRLPAQLCLRFGVSVRLKPDFGEQLPDQLIVVVSERSARLLDLRHDSELLLQSPAATALSTGDDLHSATRP